MSLGSDAFLVYSLLWKRLFLSIEYVESETWFSTEQTEDRMWSALHLDIEWIGWRSSESEEIFLETVRSYNPFLI